MRPAFHPRDWLEYLTSRKGDSMHHRIRSMLIRPASDAETDKHTEEWYKEQLAPAGSYYSICTLVETDDSFLHTTETCHERELLIQVAQLIMAEIPELAFPEEHTGQQALAQEQERGRAEEAMSESEAEAQAELHKRELALDKEDFEARVRNGQANEDAEGLSGVIGEPVDPKDLPDEEEQDDNLP